MYGFKHCNRTVNFKKQDMLYILQHINQKHIVFEQVGVKKYRNMQEVFGDKRMYLTYYVHLVGINRSD